MAFYFLIVFYIIWLFFILLGFYFLIGLFCLIGLFYLIGLSFFVFVFLFSYWAFLSYWPFLSYWAFLFFLGFFILLGFFCLWPYQIKIVSGWFVSLWGRNELCKKSRQSENGFKRIILLFTVFKENLFLNMKCCGFWLLIDHITFIWTKT